jgi:hypothetical protein
MIRYSGLRLDVQALVDEWLNETRGPGEYFIGEVRDVPTTGELIVAATVSDGHEARSVSLALAAWLRRRGIRALP